MVSSYKIVIIKTALLIALILFSLYSHCQEDVSIFNDIFSSLSKKSLFKSLDGTFFDNIIQDTVDGEKRNRTYIYSSKFYNIKYGLDICDCFSVMGKVVIPSKYYNKNEISACEFDETSLVVYKGFFAKNKYILITGINNGNNYSALNVFCMLFDVTDINCVKFYPLWSKYGGVSCFGDFNNDGKLDFLKVRSGNKKNHLKITLMTLSGEDFNDFDDKHYIIAERVNNGIKIVKKNWW